MEASGKLPLFFLDIISPSKATMVKGAMSSRSGSGCSADTEQCRSNSQRLAGQSGGIIS